MADDCSTAQDPHSTPAGPPTARRALTQREREILHLAASGHTNGAIGERLGVSPQTVKNLLRHAFRRLGAYDRTHAVILALKAGHFGLDDVPDRRAPETHRARMVRGRRPER
jgi:LuxR family transcriptional regulator, regulator of acetate metabolism